MTPEEAMTDAMRKHPDCKYADWENGMNAMFQMTIVVNLWRNEECFIAGDPPRHTIEGYSKEYGK